ncbi:MAG TPA: DUF1326 domain-containing protein [Geminicoccaceae bacterium]
MSSWHLRGTYFESCNCDAACPCVFLSRPTEGECTVLIGWHIEDGADGEVRLDGLNAALAVYSPGHMMEVKWQAAAYLDERADERQKEALLRIFGGHAGGVPGVLAGFIGEMKGVGSVPIDFRAEGRQRSLTIPGVAAVEIEAISGQNDEEVSVSGHPLAVAPGFPAVVGRSRALEFTDHGWTWSLNGKNGFFSPFAYEGDG